MWYLGAVITFGIFPFFAAAIGKMGPYEYILIEEFKGEDKTLIKLGDVRVEKLTVDGKEDTFLVGNVILDTDIDDTVSATIVARDGDGKEVLKMKMDPLCESSPKNPEIRDLALNHLGHPLECPVKSGSYDLIPMATKLKLKSLPKSLPTGRFNAELDVKQGDTQIGLFQVTVQVVPKTLG